MGLRMPCPLVGCESAGVAAVRVNCRRRYDCRDGMGAVRGRAIAFSYKGVQTVTGTGTGAVAWRNDPLMEEFTSALNNLTTLLIVIGGSLFTLCLAAGAILYMTAAGDPRKQQLARGALLSSIIGVVILAMAPIAPRVLSRFVIEPSGGQALDRVGQSSCDRTLRSSLITQRGVSTTSRVNSMIAQIQAQRRNDWAWGVEPPVKLPTPSVFPFHLPAGLGLMPPPSATTSVRCIPAMSFSPLTSTSVVGGGLLLLLPSILSTKAMTGSTPPLLPLLVKTCDLRA